MRYLLCTAAVLVLAAILTTTSSAAIRGQRIEVASLPEDGARPFLMVFTQDPPTAADQFALDAIRGFGIGADVRFHHITAGGHHFTRWEERHGGRTPFLAIVAADRKKILRQVKAAEMPATAAELFQILAPTEEEAKGRMARLLPWRRRVADAIENQPVAKPAPVVTVTRNTLPDKPDPVMVAALQPAGLLDSVNPVALLLSILGGGAAGGAIQWRRSLAK